MGRLNLLHGEDEVGAVRSNRHTELILAKAEEGVLGFFGVAEFEDGVGGGYGTSFAEREMELLGEVVEGDLVRTANGGGELIGFIAGQPVGLGEQQGRLDRILYFFEGLGVSGFLVEDLDNVEAVLGLYEVGELAFVDAEGGFIK